LSRRHSDVAWALQHALECRLDELNAAQAKVVGNKHRLEADAQGVKEQLFNLQKTMMGVVYGTNHDLLQQQVIAEAGLSVVCVCVC
jgi:hypothetical protein